MTTPSTQPTPTPLASYAPGVAAVTRLVPSGPPHVATTDGSLALAGRPRTHRAPGDSPSGRTQRRPDLRVLDGGEARTRAWTLRFFQVLVEVLGGDRNPQQLLRSTSTEVFADLGRRAEVLNRVSSPVHRRRRLRATVRSVHVSLPTPTAAEVCARVEHGGRSRVIAGRLELTEGRWRCTALEFG